MSIALQVALLYVLAHSPLSDAVVVACLERDTTVNENAFRDVMLKNMPVSQDVWEVMLAKLDSIKDPNVEDTLRLAQVRNPLAVTATSLKREIRYHGGWTHQYADAVVLHYIENDALDSAKTYMDSVNLYPLRLALLGTELSDGNWNEADSSLAKLPLKTVNDTAVYNLFGMLIALGRDSLTLLDMSSIDSTRIGNIAADSTLDAAVMAKGIMSVLLDTFYFEMPEQVPDAPSERRGEEDAIIASPTETEYFKAYPNPFTQSTTIEYDLGKECELGCQLRLFDLQGRVIMQEILTAENGKGSFVIDMGRYGNGIYYCTLYGDNRLLQTAKLILIK